MIAFCREYGIHWREAWAYSPEEDKAQLVRSATTVERFSRTHPLWARQSMIGQLYTIAIFRQQNGQPESRKGPPLQKPYLKVEGTCQ